MIYVSVFMIGFITALLTSYAVIQFLLSLFSTGGDD